MLWQISCRKRQQIGIEKKFFLLKIKLNLHINIRYLYLPVLFLLFLPPGSESMRIWIRNVAYWNCTGTYRCNIKLLVSVPVPFLLIHDYMFSSFWTRVPSNQHGSMLSCYAYQTWNIDSRRLNRKSHLIYVFAPCHRYRYPYLVPFSSYPFWFVTKKCLWTVPVSINLPIFWITMFLGHEK